MASQVKAHNSSSLFNFSYSVSNPVNVLKACRQFDDLQSSSTLNFKVDTLPQPLKQNSNRAKNFSDFKGERKEEDRRNTKRDKRFSKTVSLNTNLSVKETKQTKKDHRSLADGTQKIWNCPLLGNIIVSNRYAAVSKQRLRYGCLGKEYVTPKKLKSKRAV